ncbi:hypothetical protein PFAG_05341 [Plasmodium falciparum Santa Lucia]|uniref:Selenoprotein n=5 Tax=Plasmodium falciparum TaxID=5833 RepID=A0A024WJE8_PLAFA|nr:hypothetical protein PFFVO_04887 [Plasmodium falciparum Vietnam Oak-Knoll (FVO)]ETW40020.1 hypothetical protein PFNF135_06046 [Plasmodium falciparum NF135/5.C10]ETW46805.1 hypothetical protein PFMALIP_05086 [Plasmodium falciparum MaliPS096_E11]EUR63552.1 hypothetical protein PFBG_05300 [Plasmodium falciparum 7G8]EUT78764.1 hypothetical protein PFAG_05341 [Plasmodium falciparum Santa Lucia]
MDTNENMKNVKDMMSFTTKNIIYIFIGISLLIFIYKILKKNKKDAEVKRNNEISIKMKLSREKQLQELDKEMMINKEKMKEQNIKKNEEKKKDADQAKPKLGSKDNSSFNHLNDYSNYYRPSLKNRFVNCHKKKYICNCII